MKGPTRAQQDRAIRRRRRGAAAAAGPPRRRRRRRPRRGLIGRMSDEDSLPLPPLPLGAMCHLSRYDLFHQQHRPPHPHHTTSSLHHPLSQQQQQLALHPSAASAYYSVEGAIGGGGQLLSAEACLDELFKLTPDLDLLNRIKAAALMGDGETLDEYSEMFGEHVDHVQDICARLFRVSDSDALQIRSQNLEICIPVYGPQVVAAAQSLCLCPSSKVSKENLEVFSDMWLELFNDVATLAKDLVGRRRDVGLATVGDFRDEYPLVAPPRDPYYFVGHQQQQPPPPYPTMKPSHGPMSMPPPQLPPPHQQQQQQDSRPQPQHLTRGPPPPPPQAFVQQAQHHPPPPPMGAMACQGPGPDGPILPPQPPNMPPPSNVLPSPSLGPHAQQHKSQVAMPQPGGMGPLPPEPPVSSSEASDEAGKGGPADAAAEAQKWQESQEESEIYRRAKTMCKILMMMEQFTSGTGTLETTQDLFTQAEFFAEEANKLYKNVRCFSYQVPSGDLKNEMLLTIDQLPTYVQQLNFTVKTPTVGKAATFTKVDNVIQETKHLVDLVSRVVNYSLQCAKQYSLDLSQPRLRSRTLSPSYREDGEAGGVMGVGSSPGTASTSDPNL